MRDALAQRCARLCSSRAEQIVQWKYRVIDIVGPLLSAAATSVTWPSPLSGAVPRPGLADLGAECRRARSVQPDDVHDLQAPGGAVDPVDGGEPSDRGGADVLAFEAAR
jgi:hypothetical protein